MPSASRSNDSAPWDAPVDGAVAVTEWQADGTPTTPFGPGGFPWDSPVQVVDGMAQALARDAVLTSGEVVEERDDGTVIGWVRMTLDHDPQLAADLRLVIAPDGDAWAVVDSSSRTHCSRPLTDGDCR